MVDFDSMSDTELNIWIAQRSGFEMLHSADRPTLMYEDKHVSTFDSVADAWDFAIVEKGADYASDLHDAWELLSDTLAFLDPLEMLRVFHENRNSEGRFGGFYCALGLARHIAILWCKAVFEMLEALEGE